MTKGAVLIAQRYMKLPNVINIIPSMMVLPPISIVGVLFSYCGYKIGLFKDSVFTEG